MFFVTVLPVGGLGQSLLGRSFECTGSVWSLAGSLGFVASDACLWTRWGPGPLNGSLGLEDDES